MFQRIFKAATLLSFLFIMCAPCNAQKIMAQGEIIYHVFQRSFYDSNGDNTGDINGLREKLNYLQDLGVTSILLLPLYESVFYHNYFAGNFEKIDPEFGTMQDFLNLIEEVHKRGMKIYLDMETQYITEDHQWWKDSYGNLPSKYSDYILYDDSEHLKPSSIIFDIKVLKGYDGATRKVATVNLKSQKVLDYNYRLFKYFIDPNNDGEFDDGVDGFRLDHAMDNLDWKGRLTNLFEEFWKPLLARLREANPNIKIVAEQANWGSFGFEYLENATVDRVFAFRLQQAIASFDKNKIGATADTVFSLTPLGKQQVVFIENHDMQRFASAVSKNLQKEKIGAAFNLLIGGIPSIYYGQELGMFGSGGFNKFGNTDANDIPQREAFEWCRADSGKGMAIWYKNTGPWCDSANLKSNDGISLEEEKNDSGSLYNFYKRIIHLRQTHSEFVNGKYQTLRNDNDSVFSFLRYESYKAGIVVVLNLSNEAQQTDIDITNIKIKFRNFGQLYGDSRANISSNNLSVNIPPYGIEVWELK
jgi:alpha-amylase